MRKLQLISLAGIVLLSIVLIAAAWEFAFADQFRSLFWPEDGIESVSEHWYHVVTVGCFAALSLVVPLWISSRDSPNGANQKIVRRPPWAGFLRVSRKRSKG